jgi:hypothetical protein
MWALRSTEKMILPGTVAEGSSLVASAAFAAGFVSRRSRDGRTQWPESLFEAPADLEDMVRDALDPSNIDAVIGGEGGAAGGGSSGRMNHADQQQQQPSADHWSIVRDVSRAAGAAPASKEVRVLRDPNGAEKDETFLLPVLTRLASCLKTHGARAAVVLVLGDSSLCLGLEREPPRLQSPVVAGAEALLQLTLFDPCARPAARLAGASVLRFSTLRGMQLHLLTLLPPLPGAGAGVGDPTTTTTTTITTVRTVTSDVQFPVASNPDVLLVPVVDADGGGNGNNGNGELEDALNKVRKHAKAALIAQKRRELEELQAHLGRSPPPPLSRDSTAANTTAISTGDEQQQQQEEEEEKKGELAAAPAAAATPVAGPASVGSGPRNVSPLLDPANDAYSRNGGEQQLPTTRDEDEEEGKEGEERK